MSNILILLLVFVALLALGLYSNQVKKFVKGLFGRKKPKEKMRVNSTGKLVYFREFIEDEIYNQNKLQ